MKYKIIALMGQSGSGKDSILKSILSSTTNLNKIVASSTRPKREYEINGKDYYFITREEMAQKILDSTMIEVSCFNDWFYGTDCQALKDTKVNIGIYSPSAISNLLDDKNLEVSVFYIQATDKNRLLRQLNREENPDVKEIIRRYKTDQEDFYDIDFEYTILDNNSSDDFNRSVKIILDYAEALAKTI